MESMTFRLQGVVRSAPDEQRDFEGPLDLILKLLSRDKIEIRDIRISDLVDQYIRSIEGLSQIDLEVASEFVAMASYLVYLKTKTLLAIDEEDAAREMDELIKSLEERKHKEEYRKIKQAVEYLALREEIGRSTYVRRPTLLPKMRSYGYTHPKEDIVGAIIAVAGRSQRKLPPPVAAFSQIIKQEPYPVEDKSYEIIRAVLQRGAQKFSSLLRRAASRSEIVAAFLAVLELLKVNRLKIRDEDGEYVLLPGENKE